MAGISGIKKINGWIAATALLVALIIAPNLSMIAGIAGESNDNWKHITGFLLKDYIMNTAYIVVATGIITAVIGFISAWLVSFYKFPFSRIINWILLLPLVIPPYIGAYVYNGILGYSGTLSVITDGRIKGFDIMNINGAVFIYSMFLYPYVYIMVKAYFEKQSAAVIEAARGMGATNLKILGRILLPMSATAMAGGVSLVLMEVINDYGVVKYFGIQTFSTAIFKVWFSMGDIETAIKLAGMLMVVVITLLIAERAMRGKSTGSFATTKIRPVSKKRLYGIKAAVVTGGFAVLLSAAFIIPMVQLIYWASGAFSKAASSEYIGLTLNSLMLALAAAFIITVSSIIIGNTTRLYPGTASRVISKIVAAGYSIPAAVVAVSIIVVFVFIEKRAGIDLTNTLVMLMFAYYIRFAAIGYNSIETGFEKIGRKFHEASRISGKGITSTFFYVDFPMMTPAVVGAVSLAAIDIIKELPLTLILRPFNFNTLATRAYEYADDEMIQEASLSALLMIALSFCLLYVINIVKKRSTKRGTKK